MVQISKTEHTLHRIPVIGLVLSVLLELPALYKSIAKTKGSIIDKSKAFGKQTVKSSGYIVLMTAGIGVAGAVLYPYSAVFGLIGMAVGSTVALITSNKLNKQIDKLV